MCLPNFLIIGTAKAGTSTVYEWCKLHPDIFVPEIKEPHFFEMEGADKSKLHPSDHNVVVDIEEYKRLFSPGANAKARGEATVFYMLSDKAARRIFHYIPHCKIILMVRNPVERAYSHYLYSQQIGRAPMEWSFRDALNNTHPVWDFKYREMGLYREAIERFESYFPPAQIHILFFDDLLSDPSVFARHFFSLLGVDENFEVPTGLHYAKSGLPRNQLLHRLVMKKFLLKDLLKLFIPKTFRLRLKTILLNRNLEKPPLDPAMRKALTEYYREDIQWLEKRTGRDLSHWLRAEDVAVV